MVLVMAISCDEIELGNEFLAKPPALDYTRDSVFTSSQRAKEALWYAYSTLPQGISDLWNQIEGSRGGVGVSLQASVTDLTANGNPHGYVNNLWANGTYNAESANADGDNQPSIYDFYGELGWNGIRASNIFLNNIDKVPDMTQEEKELLKAEARMIIATHYTEMFRAYGGVLWVDQAYKATDKPQLQRLTVLQSIDSITSIIDEAMVELPFELDNPDVWMGRFTSAGALALKVKLLEFAAAPLLNNDEPYMPESYEAVAQNLVWTGGYQRELWEQLRDVSKELIDKIEASSYYGLVDTGDPEEDYEEGYWGRTGETLLSFRKIYDFGWSTAGPNNWRANRVIGVFWTGFRNPQHNYVMKFPMQNGMSIENPESGYDPQRPYYNRDPRLYRSIKVNGSKHMGRKAELWIGGRDRPQKNFNRAFTGYMLYKWVGVDRRGTREIYHWPYVRIPEVYFAYAEALAQLSNGTIPSEAFEYVNKVRERVEVGPIEDFIGKPKEQITKEEFIDALLNERAVELGVENIRWYDMARYKLEDIFKAELYTMNAYLTEEAEQIDNFSAFYQDEIDFSEHDQYFRYEVDKTERGDMWSWRQNWSPKWYLVPFPYNEIQKDYGIVQNPGWEINTGE